MPDLPKSYLPGSSVTPRGRFLVGLHCPPPFTVANLREQDLTGILGHTGDGSPVDNRRNFPAGDVQVANTKYIYEIANAFPFRGATFIDSGWADARAADPASIALPPPAKCSLRMVMENRFAQGSFKSILPELPLPVLYGLAANSTDPEELTALAGFCCRLEHDDSGRPVGLRFMDDGQGGLRADIDDFALFETIANNPWLPDAYKEVMVLRPGVQGASEIVGEWQGSGSHVFEYLRGNSYIPGGHYASNMASDAIRYQTADLSLQDMQALRHLYYQRTYAVLAGKAGIPLPAGRRKLSTSELEDLRRRILQVIDNDSEQVATLWGWNFGYDFSASGYRLHASHQMIHQQYAMVPQSVATDDNAMAIPSYSCGDLVADTIQRYRSVTGSDFFSDLLAAVRGNIRTDRKKGENNLVVWEDENVLLFVPKAQVSQWELQLLVTADTFDGPVGNVVEADTEVRDSIDRGILTAQKIFAGLGARMVTSIEFPKRLRVDNGQRLLYSFLPKLPWSMGAFSEAQLRFICGHYPEDFAVCCRLQLKTKNIYLSDNTTP
ncbi:MAG: hypothetical protein M8357_08765 [Desulfobulbaceae bacterium]|nr:hypothetical protein [Desulfobulbaceae bacterium]